MCKALNLILQDYCRSINSSGATFEDLQNHHIIVMNTVKKVDKCLSLPLFIVLGIHTLLLFFSVTSFSLVAKKIVNLEMFFYWSFISNMFQYIAITNFAAKIHEEVQNIKIETAEMSCHTSQLSVGEQILLIAKVNSHSNISLTVWGFINITKSFVFSSLGALITFGALYADL
ncbi:hypothetical protein NPIL_2091 [Nephila pilipes]|uniref:Uncharacterized protein n=1 Tax=Nephila pilipes TaxID=299642 RepID=A0A8X6NL16_NEPPI|nr:hypothetical protein NPIL_2091 [Nephila pilipes]